MNIKTKKLIAKEWLLLLALWIPGFLIAHWIWKDQGIHWFKICIRADLVTL